MGLGIGTRGNLSFLAIAQCAADYSSLSMMAARSLRVQPWSFFLARMFHKNPFFGSMGGNVPASIAAAILSKDQPSSLRPANPAWSILFPS